MIRVVVVDDHEVVRRGVSSVLGAEAGIEVVGEAAGAREALRIVSSCRPDVALVDLSLDGSPASGLELCRRLCDLEHPPKVLVFSAALSALLVAEAVRHGAAGYVCKEADASELADLLRAVARGEPGFDALAGSFVLGALAGRGSEVLSQREAEIVSLVAKGLTNTEIAARCYLSQSTVKYHIANVARKLGVSGRAEIVFAASKSGLI